MGGGKTELQLVEFDMSRIKDNSIVIFIGKRNSGKSFLIRDLLYHHRTIPVGTVLSGTESANGFYTEMVPEMFIHHDFSPEVVQRVMRRQMMMASRVRAGEQIDPRAFCIFDDLMFDSKEWIKDKSVKEIFFNGRHFSLFYLLTMQFPLGIPPELRTNVDYVFLLREPFMSNRKRLYDHYAGMFGSFDAFNQVMNQCTEDYHCLVLDNTTKSNRLQDQVFWYKGKPRPEFRLGSKQFWDSSQNEKIREQRRQALFNSAGDGDGGVIGKKKSAQTITVQKVSKSSAPSSSRGGSVGGRQHSGGEDDDLC